MQYPRRFGIALVASATLLASGAALAVDGVVLIDQNKALAGGVTPGDAAGFPVTITQPGSYRLSGNLTVPDANTTAITIAASNVTIDLNGFSILGPVVCTGTSSVTSCAPAGNGDGIESTIDTTTSSLRANITVMNGTIKGTGAYGVKLDGCQGCTVEKVTASHNGIIGILIGRGRVSESRAFSNGLRGIQNASGPMLYNHAAFNKEIGIIANCPGSVIGNVAEFNGTQGLFINGGSCVAATNSTAP